MIAVFWTMLAMAGPVADGAQAWERGAIDEALITWQAALEEGRGSAALHTNLGVAWYRKGDPSRALAHWRMARHLSPRSGDPAHNLAVVRSELEGTPRPVPSLPVPLQLATVGEYGVLGTIALLIASVGSWFAWLRRLSAWPWIGIAVVGAVMAGISLWGAHVLREHPFAVAVHDAVVLRVDPDLSAPAVRRLPVGSELTVERATRDFLLLRTGDGARGWATRGSVAVVGVELDLPEPLSSSDEPVDPGGAL